MNLLIFKPIKLKVINLVYDYDIILNVDNFNKWFNDPNKSKDIYAHPGIFLRLDKLSEHHFDDYFKSCAGVDDLEHFKNDLTYSEYCDFEYIVRMDWKSKK